MVILVALLHIHGAQSASQRPFPHSDSSGRLPCKAEFEAGFIDPSVIWQPILPTEQQPSPYVCIYNICFIPVRTPQQHHCDTHRFQMSASTMDQTLVSPNDTNKTCILHFCTRTFNALFRIQSTIHFSLFIVKTHDSRCKTLRFPSHCYMRIETQIFCVDKHLTGRNRVYMITWAIFLSLSNCHSESCIVASVQTVEIGVFIS